MRWSLLVALAVAGCAGSKDDDGSPFTDDDPLGTDDGDPIDDGDPTDDRDPTDDDATDEDGPVDPNDRDGDGAAVDVDCDDEDEDVGSVLVDGDCDGTRKVDDCDDDDPTAGHRANDADCDRVSTADDCDDQDAESTTRADDADCDGAAAAADCDDTTPALGARLEDADCDAVKAGDDCDDLWRGRGAWATDGDCDGALLGDDCDDGHPERGVWADDADCDGALTADDCDDGDPAFYPKAPDLACDALDQDCNGVADDVARTYTVVGPNAYIEAPVVFFSPFSEYIYDDGETTYVTLGGEDERAVVTWDETGRLTRLEVFAPDYHEVWTGVLTGRNSDYTHEINGIPRASGHRERDFAWRTTVFDTVIDGVATEEDWTYGSDGATTHYTQVVNGALSLESIVTRTPEGVRIAETAGGITNARVQHLDPVSGLVVSVDYDDLDDGFPDRITHVTYDAEGRMTALTQDDGADGVDDQRWEWAYDAFGTEILATWDSDDRNLDPDTTEITTTDAEGRWLTYSYDSEDRGTDPDYTSAQTYDADGHVLTYTNSDGLSRTYAWSGDDMLWFEVDEAGDGFAETRVAFTYETDGTLTTDRTDNDGDRVRESGSDRFTDLAGNIVRRTWYDGDTRIGWLDSWTCETDRDGDSVVGWDDCDDDDDAIGAFDEDQSCPAPE